MRKSTIFLIASLFLFSLANGQKPVARQTMTMFQNREPESFTLFNPAGESKGDLSRHVESSYTLTIRNEVLQQLHQKDPGLIRLALPEPFNIELDLYKVSVFSHGARIMTSDGISRDPNPNHHFYRGMIKDKANSLAIVSVFENRVQILYSDENGNRRIQKNQDGTYLAFNDKDLVVPQQMECFTEDTPPQHNIEGEEISGRSVSGNCVEVYVECDYKSYTDNGSNLSNTEEWVAELWHEVITLYDNEDIPVSVSDVLVYTSTDPFASLGSTSAVLSAFVTHIQQISYDGRLAHFLSTRSLGGGIAYLDVLCSTTVPCAVSASLSTTIVPVPNYSWNVEVVTHEMGHNMGSHHTHACAWNGNNTQIDDCGNQWAYNSGQTPEGNACFNPSTPILPTSGTIMSYCHLIGGIGINFNNGFGEQPGNRIRTKYNNANCNTGTCTPPVCSALSSPEAGETGVDVYQNISWTGVTGAAGYKLTIGTSPTGGEILNNTDVGLVTTYDPVNALPFNATIYVKIIPYNELGDATCSNESFTTEANSAPLCTQLMQPTDNSNDVALNSVLMWDHSEGNQTGYKIKIGTTPDGSEIANNINVGNVNSYDPPGLLPYSCPVYVKITPYNGSGDVSGCVTEDFTTATPITGDFCSIATPLPCGTSVSGTTIGAYADTEATNCGTSVDAPGVWFTFVGDGNNSVVTSCNQAGYDIKLNVYRGSCSGLVCVTGNDDYCNQTSLVSFPTTNGTTYFIFVQGWGGQIGTFTLTRTCYTGPHYCPSQSVSASTEWVKSISVNGTVRNSASSLYSDFTTDAPVVISRGGIYPMTITPQFAQGPRNEYYRVWIDFNKDGDFTDSGEQVLSVGPTTSAATANITIPLTATTGISRMRVSMRFGGFPTSSCGSFANGEVEDYAVSIRCNLVTATADSGNGSLRNVTNCADDNEEILFAPTLNNQTINITAGQLIADGQWKWMPGTNTNITIMAQGVDRVLTIPQGKTVEIHNLTIVGGTATTGSAIDNAGTLIMRDTDVQRATGSGSVPLRNTGAINIQGSCDIKI